MSYLDIVEEIAAPILAGELPAGSPVPSTREITRRWGVAMATATKVLAELRRKGLVTPIRGVGTVVSMAAVADPRSAVPSELGTSMIVWAAIKVADSEGIEAVSMRRIAANLHTSAMALYRHVGSKEELLLSMRDASFGEVRLPDSCPQGWRAQIELAAVNLWAMYRRHPWLAATTSLTRPYPGPHQLAYAEWSLRAWSLAGLEKRAMFDSYVSVINFIHGTASSLYAEIKESAETGLQAQQWIRRRAPRDRRLITSGSYPHVAATFLSGEISLELDRLFEVGLDFLLDGIELQVATGRA